MSNAASSIAPPDIGDPLAGNRPFRQRFEPHGPTYCGMRNGDFMNGFGRDERNIPIREHLDAVIGDAKEGVLKIKQFTWNING